MTKLLVLIGSGPGIGVATASLFASNGFSVALLSRDAERLASDAEKVQSAAASGSKISTFAVDASDAAALKSTLKDVAKQMGPPEVVVYNAARVGPSEFGKFTPEELLQDFKLNGVGMYVAAEWAVPHMTQLADADTDAHPSFLLSGSGINYQPFAPFWSLSMMKAAQSNFLKSLEQMVGDKVHVARIDINGIVSPDAKECSPTKVAEQHWRLYQQKKSSWEYVVDVGDHRTFAGEMGIKWQEW